jgi:hypothetical protein
MKIPSYGMVPDASIDVEMQLEALCRGERKLAYFPNRCAEEIPRTLYTLSVEENGQPGVVVFTNPRDRAQYEQEIAENGIQSVNARWLGYRADKNECSDGGTVISVLRHGGVVHDELVPPFIDQIIKRVEELENDPRFRGCVIDVTTVPEALRNRVARYSDADKKRFL